MRNLMKLVIGVALVAVMASNANACKLFGGHSECGGTPVTTTAALTTVTPVAMAVPAVAVVPVTTTYVVPVTTYATMQSTNLVAMNAVPTTQQVPQNRPVDPNAVPAAAVPTTAFTPTVYAQPAVIGPYFLAPAAFAVPAGGHSRTRIHEHTRIN